MGRPSLIDIRIAGFITELKLDYGYFSVYPVNIREIEKADLIIIPSIFHDGADIVEKNTSLIAWIRDQYKAGAEIASICAGAFFCWLPAAYWMERPVLPIGVQQMTSGDCFQPLSCILTN